MGKFAPPVRVTGLYHTLHQDPRACLAFAVRGGHFPGGSSRAPLSRNLRGYSGPLMPPSFLTRQKCTAISTLAPKGIATQCKT